jgi:hypothetical protein
MSDPPADRTPTNKASRTQRPFPAVAFEDAAVLAQQIQRLGGGQPRIRRLTLFEQLKRSPTAGWLDSRSSTPTDTGLTKGSYRPSS